MHALLVVLISSALADMSCPLDLVGTCLVCVIDLSLCPTEQRCSADTPYLCSDGVCYVDEAGCEDSGAGDACQASCGKACAMQTMQASQCESLFEELHRNSSDIVGAGDETSGAFCQGDCIMCVNDTQFCPAERSCNASSTLPFLCPDGQCYVNATQCLVAYGADGDVCLGEGQACLTLSERCVPPEEEEEAEAVTDWTQASFVFIYVFFCSVVALSLSFCCVNQRLFAAQFKPTKLYIDGEPQQSIARSVEVESACPDAHDVELQELSPNLLHHASEPILQLGYRESWPGTILYALVVGWMGGVHLLMLLLTYSYYTNDDEADRWTAIPNYDDCLIAFEVVWSVGAVFMWGCKSAGNLRVHFLARCSLQDATVVRVWQPVQHKKMLQQTGQMDSINCLMGALRWGLAALFSFLYSDIHRPVGEGSFTSCAVHTATASSEATRYIDYQLCRLTFNKDGGFEAVRIPIPATSDGVINTATGLSEQEATSRLRIMGPNLISVPKPNPLLVLITEFDKGFYTYQSFMAWTWFNFSYWHMGIVITCAYSLGGLVIALATYRNGMLLHKLHQKDNQEVQVERAGTMVTKSWADVVPGDLVRLSAGVVQSDCVIIRGQCVMDESNLTGESMPVRKAMLEAGGAFDKHGTHKKNTLFAGTTMQPTGGHEVTVLVLHTGGSTDKGKQVRKILYEPLPQFQFDVQVQLVVCILIVYAILGFAITVTFVAEVPVYAWFYGMYVVAAAIPQLLPTVFVVSVGIASDRLLRRGVVCSDPRRLLAAGKVSVCCFDKTGTLTKQGMEFHGVRHIVDNGAAGGLGDHQAMADPGSHLEAAMAACQSLACVDGSSSLVGNSVDLMMFQAVGWTLDDRSVISNEGRRLTLARMFQFDHRRQTMTVVVRQPGKPSCVYTKGSAEAVAALCDVIPDSYGFQAEEYARSGAYTLAVAWRQCTEAEENLLADEQIEASLLRDDVEQGLTPLGFLTFKNELKPDTAQAIELLNQGDCRVLMITGDHPLTAIHIGLQCGLIPSKKDLWRCTGVDSGDMLQWVGINDKSADPPLGLGDAAPQANLVLLGETWRGLVAEEQERLLPLVRVFARCSPEDKLNIVRMLTADHIVAMCGDGGNDCGALRAAHVGVALSDSEASVVSPFTGVTKSCMCVVDVLLEGRCGLATSFACYKYMIMYGQVETMNQIINAWFGITFAEWCWVFMDGFWVVIMAFSLALARPATILADERPTSSLLGHITLSSTLGVLLIHFMFTVIALAVLHDQPWFQCRQWDKSSADLGDLEAIGDNYESSVMFLVTGAQYLSSAMAFNFGFKHRQPWCANYVLMLFLAVFLTIHAIVIFVPSKLSCLFRVNCEDANALRGALDGSVQTIQNSWQTTVMPPEFRTSVFLIILVNTVVVMLWEYVVVHGPLGRFIARLWRP